MNPCRLRRILPRLAAGALLASMSLFAANSYTVTPLTSDVPNAAPVTDVGLVNAWGIAHGPNGPWWVNAAATGTSRVYDASGNPSLIVSIQPPIGGSSPSAPTGIAFNSTPSFPLTPGNPSLFLFVTEGGTIAGWSPTVSQNHGITKVDNKNGAIYKGMTLGVIQDTGNFLYAANFHAGTVEVYDAAFRPVTLPTGAFVDPKIPAGFAPFNMQNIGGKIYVAYAKQDANAEDEVAGPGMGFVSVFSPAGTLLRRLQYGTWFNAPWGITMAPDGFGSLGGSVLVGNFGSGTIVAFDANTGMLKGALRDSTGAPVVIPGLWGLGFGDGGPSGDANALYFGAGISNEAHGLFGKIVANP